MRRALLAAVLLWPGAASAGVTLRTIDTSAYPKIRATVVAPAPPAVLGHGRRCRRHDGRPNLRVGARVDGTQGYSGRGGSGPEQDGREQRPPHLRDPSVDRIPSDPATKKSGESVTPFAASFSRKLGFSPVHSSGSSSRPGRPVSASGGRATNTS